MYAKNFKGKVTRPESPILSKVDYTEPNVRELLFDKGLFNIIHTSADKSMIGIDVSKASTLGINAENVPEAALNKAQEIHGKAIDGANDIISNANMYIRHGYSAIYNVKEYFSEIIDRVESDLTRIVVCLGDELHKAEIDFSTIIDGFKSESRSVSRIITLASRGLHIRGEDDSDKRKTVSESAKLGADNVDEIVDPGKFEKIIPVTVPEDEEEGTTSEVEAKSDEQVAPSDKTNS